MTTTMTLAPWEAAQDEALRAEYAPAPAPRFGAQDGPGWTWQDVTPTDRKGWDR